MTKKVIAGMIYRVEYTIQETTCPHNAEAVTAERCPLMDCEFAHKGFCKAALTQLITGEENIDVDCEIYEPEAAEREKKLHLLGGETDHSHHDAHSHSQGRTHAADQMHLALGHNHSHLHEHEHHHHQLGQEPAPHDHPQGVVTRLLELGQLVTLPSFPDVPAGDPEVRVILPLKPDPQIPGQMEPTIEAFPTSVSAQCPTTNGKYQEVEELFTKDPTFKSAA